MSSFGFVCVLIFFGLLSLLATQLGSQLPFPKDDAKNFSEIRSHKDLLSLAQKIGTRPGSGRETIEKTQEFIVQILKEFKKEAAKEGWQIKIEELQTNGKYSWKTYNYFYKNFKQLLVHVEPILYKANSECSGKFLVNTHIDSAVGSPGAGDDGIAVSIALETIRVLIKNPPNNFSIPILFLFNNGEELGLLGSHGFVTKYPDIIDTIGGFINLEAAGTFGPENLFQASIQAPWLIEGYAKAVPYPRGSIVVSFQIKYFERIILFELRKISKTTH